MRCCRGRSTMGFSTDEPSRAARCGDAPEIPQDAARRRSWTIAKSRSTLRAMPPACEIMAPPGMEEMQQQLHEHVRQLGGARTKPRKLKVQRSAASCCIEEEAGKLVNEEELKRPRADECRAERHRVHRRDRQDRAPPGNHGRRRVTRRRAARPAAAGRRQHRVARSTARSRPTTSCSSPRARSTCRSPRT